MKALVVDDDPVLADVVAFTLRREGFEVIQAHDGAEALQRWAGERPDLVVLDVNLPKIDGFSVCRRIREEGDTPILLLTVRSEEDDIVQGLRLGADDYVAKPFSPRQLVARVQAVLRRAGRGTQYDRRQVGSLQLDTCRRELRIGQGAAVLLTPLESRLLDYLLLNQGHILTADAIIGHVWGAEGGERDMLRQLVRRLRAKIAGAATGTGHKVHIETVSGLGYGLVIPAVKS